MRSESFSARGRALWLSAVAVLGAGSAASAQDIGYKGPGLLGSGPTTGVPSVTESKPESKVWHNDGLWWSSMWNDAALQFRIHRLNMATHAWVDTGVAVDSRRDSHSDALWDGSKLYIASHEFSVGPGAPGRALLLMRYSYAPATDTYSLDAGFPLTIGDCRTETLVIEKDSTGKVWAVWKQALRVYYAHSLASDTSWTKPAVLPACTSDFTNDDICSLIRFGNRIGVLWSDQLLKNFYFTSHLDGAPDTDWSPVDILDLGNADDHMRLEADAAGRVFALLKNKLNQTKLFVRSVAGTWAQYLVCEKGLGVTRPTMTLEESANKVHVFFTVGPDAQGGTINKKSSALDVISFEPGIGTVIMQDSSGLPINNPSSTKQSVTAAMGQVVIAANTSQSGNYWHHEVPPVVVPGGFVLSAPSPGTAGVMNTLSITGGTPGKAIAFYSAAALGTTVVSRPNCPAGITMGVTRPISLGNATVDATGKASLSVMVPAALAGKMYHFQAVEAASCRASNVVSDQL